MGEKGSLLFSKFHCSFGSATSYLNRLLFAPVTRGPVAILLEKGEFMVCLQAKSKTEIMPTHWGNDKETLAACVAYCAQLPVTQRMNSGTITIPYDDVQSS